MTVELSHGLMKEEIDELRMRVDAVEARQNAAEARFVRIERLLGDLQVQGQSGQKLLVSLNEKMSSLVEAVLALAKADAK